MFFAIINWTPLLQYLSIGCEFYLRGKIRIRYWDTEAKTVSSNQILEPTNESSSGRTNFSDDQLAKRTKDRSSRHELLDLLHSLKSNLSNLKANGQCVNNFLTQGRPSVDEIEDLSYPLEEWMEEIEPLVSHFNAQNFATLSEENLKQEQNKCLELQEGVQAQIISIGKLQKNMLRPCTVVILLKATKGKSQNRISLKQQRFLKNDKVKVS